MTSERPDYRSPLRKSFDELDNTLVEFESALRQFHDEFILNCIDFFSRRIEDTQTRQDDREIDNA